MKKLQCWKTFGLIIKPKNKSPTLPKSKNKVGSLIVPNIFFK